MKRNEKHNPEESTFFRDSFPRVDSGCEKKEVGGTDRRLQSPVGGSGAHSPEKRAMAKSACDVSVFFFNLGACFFLIMLIPGSV